MRFLGAPPGYELLAVPTEGGRIECLTACDVVVAALLDHGRGDLAERVAPIRAGYPEHRSLPTLLGGMPNEPDRSLVNRAFLLGHHFAGHLFDRISKDGRLFCFGAVTDRAPRPAAVR